MARNKHREIRPADLGVAFEVIDDPSIDITSRTGNLVMGILCRVFRQCVVVLPPIAAPHVIALRFDALPNCKCGLRSG